MPTESHWIAPDIKFDALTVGPRHHFFASANCPWDETNRDVLAMETAFADRMPTEKDSLSLGLIPFGTKRFEAFDKSYAWNWQQGAMLQWLPQSGRKVIYNQRAHNRLISVIRDLDNNQIRTLPLPVHAVSPLGDYALSLHNQGIYRLDLKSSAWELIFSLQPVAALQRASSGEDASHSFHHIQINSDASRCAFLHRWQPIKEREETSYNRLITLNPDGSEPFVPFDGKVSWHYGWVSESQIIAEVKDLAMEEDTFLFEDRSQQRQTIGIDILDADKGITLSPNRKWILSETALDKDNFRTVLLWQWPDGLRIDVAKFYSPPELNGSLRCGLHPRWSRDGRKICIDSPHTGTRQIYVLDVSQIIQG
jgi:hypothetical protein